MEPWNSCHGLPLRKYSGTSSVLDGWESAASRKVKSARAGCFLLGEGGGLAGYGGANCPSVVMQLERVLPSGRRQTFSGAVGGSVIASPY